MNDNREYLVITFAATTAAMMMERCCRMDGKTGRMIPLPREISAGCGLCWATTETDEAAWQDYAKEKKLRWEQMVRMKL